jgi:hypothetical protein
MAVTIPGVQIISRKDRVLFSSGSGILRDSTPDSSGPMPRSLEKIKSELHGDMQRVAEMTIPHLNHVVSQLDEWSNKLSEIPCRVSSDLHEWRNDLGTVSTRGSANL